jgi:hypothetical protein
VLGAIGTAIDIDGLFSNAPMSKIGLKTYGVAAAAPVAGLHGLVSRGRRTVTVVTFGDPVVSMQMLVGSSPLTTGRSVTPQTNLPQ